MLKRMTARELAFETYDNLLWMEKSNPNFDQAEALAKTIRAGYPDHMLT